MKRLWLFIILVIGVGAVVLFFQQNNFSDIIDQDGVVKSGRTVPNPLTDNKQVADKKTETESSMASQTNLKVNAEESKPITEHAITILPVPFTTQAPFSDWGLPYQESCEEAAMLMAAEYFKGNHSSVLAADYANSEILKLVAWEKREKGFYEDTTAQQVAEIIKEYYGLFAQVEPFDATHARQAIKNKQLVLLPTAGRLLNNPHFHFPGPIYHMLVLKGFDGNEFITNDPGTRYGQSYRYTVDLLERAVHDWNNGQVEQGASVMIIVSAT